LRLLAELLGQLGPGVGAEVGQADRFAALAETCRRLLPSYRLTWDSLAWFESEAFNAYLARFGEADGFNAHRRYAVQQLLRLTAGLPGDTAECGVYQGAGSYLMAEANRQAGRNETHHGFDSFSGVSRPTGKDGSYWTEGALASPAEVARRNLAEFGDAVRLYPGWIPDRFAEVASRAFRFVHVDVDLHDPTRASLEFFYPRVVLGGVVVCDDYLFLTCPGATAAVDEFLAERQEKMVGLPGGGGFFVKGTKTAPA
jgi:predicted O-methyltransferase YrrM